MACFLLQPPHLPPKEIMKEKERKYEGRREKMGLSVHIVST